MVARVTSILWLALILGISLVPVGGAYPRTTMSQQGNRVVSLHEIDIPLGGEGTLYVHGAGGELADCRIANLAFSCNNSAGEVTVCTNAQGSTLEDATGIRDELTLHVCPVGKAVDLIGDLACVLSTECSDR